jgi:hypothetical protein
MPFKVTDNATGKVITFEKSPTSDDLKEAFGSVPSPLPEQKDKTNGVSLGGFLSNVSKDVSNLVGGTKQLITHPVETGKKIAEYQLSKTELPESLIGHDKLAGMYGAGAVVSKTAIDVAKGMYESVRHPYKQPVSALLTVSPLLKGAGGLASKVPKLAKTGEVLKTAGAVTDPFNLVAKGGRLVSKPIGWMSKQLVGTLTGKGVANVEQWMKGSKDFFNVLHGRVDEASIIASAKQGFQLLKEKRGSEYGKALKNIDMTQEIGFQGIDNTLANIGKKFRFDKGIPTLNKAEMADFENIIKIIDEIKSQPMGKTALGLDSMKQQLDYFYTQNSRISSIVSDLRKTINNEIGSKIPAYSVMNKNYAKLTSLAKDMEDTLVGKGNINTTFNKLQSAMREDAGLRRNIMNEMNKVTGVDTQAQIAGFAGKPVMASGLVGRSVEFGLAAGVLAKYVDPKMLALVLMSSPKVMSEFLGGIGWTKNQIAPLLKMQSKFPPQVIRNGLAIYAKETGEKIKQNKEE